MKLVEVGESIFCRADKINTTEFEKCFLQLRGLRQACAKDSMRMFVDSKMHVVHSSLFAAASSLCLSSRMLQLSKLVRRWLGNPTFLFCQHHVQASTSTCLLNGFAAVDPLSRCNTDQRLVCEPRMYSLFHESVFSSDSSVAL